MLASRSCYYVRLEGFGLQNFPLSSLAVIAVVDGLTYTEDFTYTLLRRHLDQTDWYGFDVRRATVRAERSPERLRVDWGWGQRAGRRRFGYCRLQAICSSEPRQGEWPR